MLQNPRVVRYSAQPFNPPTRMATPSLSPFQLIPTSPSFPILKQQCRFSRRELTIFSNSCLLLLLGAQARAEENLTLAEEDVGNTSNSDQPEENLTLAEEDVANTSNSDKPEENVAVTPS